MVFRVAFLCLLVLTLHLAATFTSDELRVTLSNGSKLVGKYFRSLSGRPIKAFMNIPYAKAPVGSLRFRAPEPLDKWEGEYKAIDDGPVCPQRNLFTRSYVDVGVEDCLRLNVYVPHSFDGKLSNLPVFVCLHGGGFSSFSGTIQNVKPHYLLDRDVILVAGNYRIGALGFLSTEDDNCPGNFGLKDQVMILKWIQENIQRFGGDPNSVTIFGGSSGAASATYLMASPLANGLFTRAIVNSGTNLASWAQPHQKGMGRKRAKQVAQRFNCYIPKDWSQTIDCLRDVPSKNMSAVYYDLFEFDVDPKVIFKPVVEPNVPGAFITDHPRDKLTENSLNRSLLIGINFNEGLIKSSVYFHLPDLFDKFAKQFDSALPVVLDYNYYDKSVKKAITDRINEFYFQNNFTKIKLENITNMFGDEWYMSPTDSYLRMRLSYKDVAPTYHYLFTHKTPATFSKVYGDPDNYYGVSHTDDRLYVMPMREELFPFILPTKDDEEIRKAMIQMWVDFARTGNPTPETSYLPKWDPVKGFPVNFYRIGNFHFEDKPMFGMETGGLFEYRAKFWREIYSNILVNASAVDVQHFIMTKYCECRKV